MIIVVRHGGLQDFMVILRPTKARKHGQMVRFCWDIHNYQIPWLCVGDFNEITSSSENAGGNVRRARQIVRFCWVIHHYAFLDRGFVGPPFIWSKNNGGDGWIKVRFDLVLANIEWQAKFQGATLHHIAMSTADYSLLPLWFPHVRL